MIIKENPEFTGLFGEFNYRIGVKFCSKESFITQDFTK